MNQSIVVTLNALLGPPSVSSVQRCIRAEYNDRSSATCTMEARFSSFQVSRATSLKTWEKVLTHLQCKYLMVKLPMIVMP
jgi:hypothetical protein